ncbi:hypothetical protein D068_cds26630 [Bacillus atrophaeus UCMB-5137]|nr:hypothetical protein D068_cds26630 [Bacillus atrophaeus UCMB-5137]
MKTTKKDVSLHDPIGQDIDYGDKNDSCIRKSYVSLRNSC